MVYARPERRTSPNHRAARYQGHNTQAVLERDSGKLPRSGSLAGEQPVAAPRTRRTSVLLTRQPDLRKARQIQRQHILASKFRPLDINEAFAEAEALPAEEVEFHYSPQASRMYIEDDPHMFIEDEESAFGQNYAPTHGRRAYSEEDLWSAPAAGRFIQPGYDDDVEDEYLPHRPQNDDPIAYGAPRRRTQVEPEPRAPVARRRSAPVSRAAYDEDEDEYRYDEYQDEYRYDEYQDEQEEAEEAEEQTRGRKKARGKKKRFSRRNLLVGLGLVAAGGVAAYELGPKLPGAISQVGVNLEHEIQDAYNRGLAAGAEAVRKDFVNSLNTLEGYSLQSAITAARLTRQAYDTFVAPIVTVAATITGDFLGIALRAVETARGWLSRIYQDNPTLAALQTILESWVKQVNNTPQALQSFTDTDLDGAQAYLRALQRKLQTEQALLNQPQQAATPTTAPKKTPGH